MRCAILSPDKSSCKLHYQMLECRAGRLHHGRANGERVVSYFRAKDWESNSTLATGVDRARQKGVDSQRDLRKRWRRAYLYFHCKHDDTMFRSALRATGSETPTDSSVFRPIITQQTLTATPRFRAALMAAGGELFAASPREGAK